MHHFNSPARKSERGFSMLEILVTLAIIAVIIVITATQLASRAEATKRQGVASAVATAIADEAIIYGSGARTGTITESGLQARVRGSLDGATLLNETTPVTVDIATSASQITAANGCSDTSTTPAVAATMVLNLKQGVSYDDANELAAMVDASIDEINDDNLTAMFGTGVVAKATTALTTGTDLTAINICIATN